MMKEILSHPFAHSLSCCYFGSPRLQYRRTQGYRFRGKGSFQQLQSAARPHGWPSMVGNRHLLQVLRTVYTQGCNWLPFGVRIWGWLAWLRIYQDQGPIVTIQLPKRRFKTNSYSSSKEPNCWPNSMRIFWEG